MKATNNIRLDGKITLLSPLSHIGESSGIDTFLSTDVVIDQNGKPLECAVYSGNAYRGQLRDLAAAYMLDKLGGIQLPIDAFYLLFSGGSLGGEQSVDIDQARLYRRNVPMLSVFGGGVGNQILTGKIKIGAMYPLVAECQRILPEYMRDPSAPSWRQWTYEKSFTRMDDAKNENLRQYLCEKPESQPALPQGQHILELSDGSENKDEQQILAEKKKKKEKGEQAQQMRYTVEMLAAGSILYQRIELCDLTDLELGAFVSALVEMNKHPYIGGKSSIGCGLCEIEYNWRPAGEKNISGKFLSVSADQFWLSKPAEDAINVYDDFLVKVYNQYLEDKTDDLKKLLGDGGKKK